MSFLTNLLLGSSTAHAIFVFGLVITLGLLIGSISIKGVKLGVAGVLFSGLAFGHFGITVDHTVLEFMREFGLILFVYTIGLQVGPGFFNSLRRQGLQLNLLAASIVFGGVLVTSMLICFFHIPVPAAVGLFSGAVTNTPSLGAAQEALNLISNVSDQTKALPGLAYAMAYPFGILGIILTMVLIKQVFRISVEKEAENFEKEQHDSSARLASVNLLVENPNLSDVALAEVPGLREAGVVVSRIMHGEEVFVARPETKIYLEDILHLVGPEKRLKDFWKIIGRPTAIDLRVDVPSEVIAREIVVTRQDMVGKSIQEICLSGFHELTATRIQRAGIEFSASPDITLEFADAITVVGKEKAIEKLAAALGDSRKELDIPHLLPLFIGIALGIIIGSFPVFLPGIPAPVKLGLAGGPLLVSIILSRLGHTGRLVWYMPLGANLMLREVGIAFFLSCVGLKSGGQFIHTLLEGQGLFWMGCGILVTFLPIATVGFIGRIKCKLNYLALCGLIAGSMTNPPALAFANSQAKSSATSLAYATVYPLVMILRVLATQLMILFLMK